MLGLLAFAGRAVFEGRSIGERRSARRNRQLVSSPSIVDPGGDAGEHGRGTVARFLGALSFLTGTLQSRVREFVNTPKMT